MSFPTYPAYKDSGVKWLSDVPEHWDVRRNKQVFRLVSVQVGNKSADFQLLSLTLRGVIPRDMESGKGKFPAEFDTYQVVEPDDIVFCLFDIDETPRTVGISSDFGMITGAYTVAKTLPAADPRFIYYYYFSIDLRKGLRPFYTGLRKVVRPETFLNIELPLPPLSEQATICNFLDHETARIDALIEEQQRLIELLKEKRQAVISHAVTKGLDPTVPMKDSGVEWLGEVPTHWEIKQLKHVVDPNSSITYGIVQAGPEFEGGVPYIRTSDMSGEELPVSGYPLTSPDIDKSYARSRVQPGDIVMSIRASVGKCLPVPDELKVANLTQGTAKISAGQQITRNFLLAFLNAGATQNYFDLMAKGATFKEITLDALRRTPVLLPPAKEQVDIDQFVARHAGLLDETCKQALQSVSLLQERRSALISAAVTGKIDVRGWQPPVSTQAPKFEVAEAN